MSSKSQKLNLLESILINIEPEKLAVVDELYESAEVKKFLADEELITTAQTFFSHNLNIIKTSQALIMHRNTLLYRINKIKNLLNLDIRKFDDAVTIQILLTVKQTELRRKRHSNKMAQLESFATE